MRICYTSDLHGSRTLYDQLEVLLRHERPDLVILGGDMLPDGADHDPAGTQASYVRFDLGPRIEFWRQAVPGLEVALLMGNHDWLESERAARAEQDAGRLTLLEPGRVAEIGSERFVGIPFSPPTPHWVKDYERLDLDSDDVPDFGGAVWATDGEAPREVERVKYFRGRPSLAVELAGVETPSEPWILVAHAPPYDTRLDQLPTVDYPIGSKAVRDFVAARRPLCALHGHVHESPVASGSFSDKIDGVLCINPGQSHEQLYAVLFDSEQPRKTLRHTEFA